MSNELIPDADDGAWQDAEEEWQLWMREQEKAEARRKAEREEKLLKGNDNGKV